MKPYILVFFLFHSLFCWGQVEVDANYAFKLAAETHRPVLLIFTGSDWCASCVRFEQNVLSQNSFLSFAKDSLVLLQADFPQRKKLSRELQNQNEELAQQFNPQGIFPMLLLLTADRSVVSIMQYTDQISVKFIADVKESLSK